MVFSAFSITLANRQPLKVYWQSMLIHSVLLVSGGGCVSVSRIDHRNHGKSTPTKPLMVPDNKADVLRILNQLFFSLQLIF